MELQRNRRIKRFPHGAYRDTADEPHVLALPLPPGDRIRRQGGRGYPNPASTVYPPPELASRWQGGASKFSSGEGPDDVSRPGKGHASGKR
uniref:Uncharacterized protein n=1 Tax=Oryza sativa subsp. japonica TaxID=39947 RepID=Q9FRH1_ORYSJ|nr:hypothetical protein [Oryza sativa Japonica Group]